MRCRSVQAVACVLAVLNLSLHCVEARGRPNGFASNVLVPQARALRARGSRAVEVTGVAAEVQIVERAATTTLDIALRNPTYRVQEAELIVPVPGGAMVRGFDFQGAGREPSARLLPREEARCTYDAIVAKLRDPALLEFVGYNLVRSSVFPVPARGRQKVRLVYETLLAAEAGRVDYELPRSESVDYDVPWKIAVTIHSKTPISTVYSPTHELTVRRTKDGVRAETGVTRQPGPFRLRCLSESEKVTTSLFAYPDDAAGGGYFLLVAGLPAAPPTRRIRREVTLVLDRSGSMDGKKMRQVREAGAHVLRRLGEDESFNIITYNQAVDHFADRPIRKTPVNEVAAILFLQNTRSRGGTNLYGALRAALRQRPAEDTLPIVLFLTDGLPTVGETSEKEIRRLAMHMNPHGRRVFTFGVGVDVNTPLLESIALETRGTSTFVLPDEDVAAKVERVFDRLAGPVLADAELEAHGAHGEPAPRRVHDVVPSRLPDLFAGDQLVVLGRYTGGELLTVAITGNFLGEPQRFAVTFDPRTASVHNAFVPRLWASRKIAVLLDQIRDLGADLGIGRRDRKTEATMQDLVHQIVRLSTQYGVLTEYTAFLAREGTDLTHREALLVEAHRNFDHRAFRRRSGIGSVNQELNRQTLRTQAVLNGRNEFLDDQMKPVRTRTVQQVADRTFYRRRGGWVEARILESQAYETPTRTIRFGTKEYMDLAYRLAQDGRQGCLAFRGDILLRVGGETVLIKGPDGT